MSSVALVVLDTLRKESFDRHFDWLPGLRYESAWSPSAWTVGAHGALFTGKYPREAGVIAKAETLDYPGPVLAERFSEGGYDTAAFSANAYVSKPFDFDRGFSTFETNWKGHRRDDDVLDWGEFISETQGTGPTRFLKAVLECVRGDVDTRRSLAVGFKLKARDMGISALGGGDDGATEALDFIRKRDFAEDSFLFVNLMEAHSPYKPPEAYRTVDEDESPGIRATVMDGPEGDPADIEQAYEDSVRYLSDMYERMFAELQEDFEYVITLGDHGESFGTDGVWAHNYGINPVLTHVPLSIYRGSDERVDVDETVSLLDVHRTLLDVAGLPAGDTRGQNLLDDPESRTQFVERFGLTRSHVENLKSYGLSAAEIEEWDRDLCGVAFPEGGYAWETREGRTSQGAVPDDADVEATVSAILDDLDERTVDELDPDAVDDAVAERLEQLGYA